MGNFPSLLEDWPLGKAKSVSLVYPKLYHFIISIVCITCVGLHTHYVFFCSVSGPLTVLSPSSGRCAPPAPAAALADQQAPHRSVPSHGNSKQRCFSVTYAQTPVTYVNLLLMSPCSVSWTKSEFCFSLHQFIIIFFDLINSTMNFIVQFDPFMTCISYAVRKQRIVFISYGQRQCQKGWPGGGWSHCCWRNLQSTASCSQNIGNWQKVITSRM